jgi:hypothetical protein
MVVGRVYCRRRRRRDLLERGTFPVMPMQMLETIFDDPRAFAVGFFKIV